MRCSVAPRHDDPLYFDREGLAAVAAAAVVGEGLRSFKEHRVITVDQDQGRLWAQVEDGAWAPPCTVEIAATDETLALACDCRDGEAVYRHMVATHYAYAERKEATGHSFPLLTRPSGIGSNAAGPRWRSNISAARCFSLVRVDRVAGMAAAHDHDCIRTETSCQILVIT